MTAASLSLSPNPQPSHSSYVLVRGPWQNLYLDLSFLSRITEVTFGALLLPGKIIDVPDAADDDAFILDVSHRLDRSLLTPKIIRFLLGRYDSCIRPQYDVLERELLSHDGAGFKKLPDIQKFNILMACAIAAARESYKGPYWKLLAQICRDWADELIAPIISAPDGDALSATLLLLVYELAEPSRGNAWELLDLARRTCLQLGWHRTLPNSNTSAALIENGSTTEESNSNSKQLGMISALQDIEV